MNIHAQRLLDVARATRETPVPDNFTMRYFGQCGSPACALGNYAVRRDLQDVFYLCRHSEEYARDAKAYGLDEKLFIRLVADDCLVSCGGGMVQQYFGISEFEAIELFSVTGCARAQTPEAAAAYIEAFVARKWPARVPDWERMATPLFAQP